MNALRMNVFNDFESEIVMENTNIRQEKSSYVHRKSDGAEFRKPSAGEPIRSEEDLRKVYQYFEDGRSSKDEVLNLRNYAIFMLGITTGLRISDLLKIKFRDILDIKKLNQYWKIVSTNVNEYYDIFQDRLLTCEQKTGKMNQSILCDRVKRILYKYVNALESRGVKYEFSDYLWVSSPYGTVLAIKDKPLNNANYYDVITKISKEVNFENKYHLSTHSMRKTFGYWMFKNSPNQMETLAILQEMFNHSNQRVTLRYIGITEDTKKDTFENFNQLLDGIFG
jgi:integrase